MSPCPCRSRSHRWMTTTRSRSRSCPPCHHHRSPRSLRSQPLDPLVTDASHDNVNVISPVLGSPPPPPPELPSSSSQQCRISQSRTSPVSASYQMMTKHHIVPNWGFVGIDGSTMGDSIAPLSAPAFPRRLRMVPMTLPSFVRIEPSSTTDPRSRLVKRFATFAVSETISLLRLRSRSVASMCLRLRPMWRSGQAVTGHAKLQDRGR